MSKLTSSQVTSKTPGILRKGTTSLKSKSVPKSSLSQQNSLGTAGVVALRRVFDELGFKDRPADYPRIIKFGRRRGDNSEFTVVVSLDNPDEVKVIKSASKRAKSAKAGKKQSAKGRKSKASSIIDAGVVDADQSSSKSAAGSTLTQLRNPRSGRFVKVDKTVGTIIAHKKSSGAYKGVPVAETISSRK